MIQRTFFLKNQRTREFSGALSTPRNAFRPVPHLIAPNLRAAQGAGPVTLRIDADTLKLVLSHAAAVHGLFVKVEPVDFALIALNRLGFIGKGVERDRHPTQEELEALITHFDANERQIIPMGRIIKFAVATAMRREEICPFTWNDLNAYRPRWTLSPAPDCSCAGVRSGALLA